MKFLLLDQIKNLDEETAKSMLFQAIADGRTDGFLQDYLFRTRTRKDGSTQFVMLNCETRLATVRTLVLISAVACAGGILLALVLVMLAFPTLQE